MDKTYLIILVSALGHESEHYFNAESRELAARAALEKYPYHHVKSLELSNGN